MTEKSSSGMIDILKAVGGIGAIKVLQEVLENIIQGFLGIEGVQGRITAFWMLCVLIVVILLIVDMAKDHKISLASIVGIVLTVGGAIWGTIWAIKAPLPPPPPTSTPTLLAESTPFPQSTPFPPSLTPSPSTTPTSIPTNTFTPMPVPTQPGAFLGGGSGELIFSIWENGSKFNSEIYALALGPNISSINTKNLHNLSRNQSLDETPAWSPDGTQIIFMTHRDGNHEIYRMDANGQNPVNITRHPDRDGQPAWSPDGAYIAFSSYRGAGSNQDIFVMDSNGTNVQQITPTGRYYQDPAWSSDGKMLYFIGWDDGKAGYTEIYVYDIMDNQVRELTNLDKFTYAPDASPDGKWLIFTSSYSGFQNLYLIGTDGYNLTQLTSQLETNYLEPAWSPDGKWIAFVAEGAYNKNTLYLYEVETGEIYPILTLPGLHNPAWQP